MRQESENLLVACRDVLSEYGGAITVRQAYYRLVAALVIPNNLRSYKRLVSHLTKWRKEGEIDPHSFTDLTRQPEYNAGWPNLQAYLRQVAEDYTRDRWEGQERKPELWLEKQALATVFIPVASRLQVTLQVCRGYPSVSTLVEAADRNTTDVIYFGDWDPSGVDIDRCIRDEMGDTWGHRIRIERIALVPEQIEEHQLPPVPPKDTDSRTSGFLAAHGEDTVELDALPPDALARLVDDSVTAYIDDEDAWEESSAREDADGERLRAYIEGLEATT